MAALAMTWARLDAAVGAEAVVGEDADEVDVVALLADPSPRQRL